MKIQTIGQQISILLALLLMHSMALPAGQRAPAPGLGIEATQYKTRCEEQKDKNLIAARAACQEAKRKLVELKRSMPKPPNPDDQAAIAQTLAEVGILSQEIDVKEKQLKDVASTLKKKEGRKELTTARDVLHDASLPPEDPRTVKLDQELQAKEAEVKRLVVEADTLAPAESKHALDVYKQAREKNKELPYPANPKEEQAMRTASFRPVKPAKAPGCHAACKITITVLVLGAVGAGGYYGYQVWKKQNGK